MDHRTARRLRTETSRWTVRLRCGPLARHGCWGRALETSVEKRTLTVLNSDGVFHLLKRTLVRAELAVLLSYSWYVRCGPKDSRSKSCQLSRAPCTLQTVTPTCTYTSRQFRHLVTSAVMIEITGSCTPPSPCIGHCPVATLGGWEHHLRQNHHLKDGLRVLPAQVPRACTARTSRSAVRSFQSLRFSISIGSTGSVSKLIDTFMPSPCNLRIFSGEQGPDTALIGTLSRPSPQAEGFFA